MTDRTGQISRELGATASYKIEKMTVSVERIFRKEGGETLNDIILKLIKKDIENT